MVWKEYGNPNRGKTNTLNGDRVDKFSDVITSDNSLELFLAKLMEFEQSFCRLMVKGGQFTIKIEVHGNVQEIIHVRLYTDEMEKPKKSQQRVDSKLRAVEVA